MTDIVERLRTGFDWDDSASDVASLIQYGDLTDEAADEIERLEKELFDTRLEIATKILDCRLCCHYGPDVYYPCRSVAMCDHGSLWERTSVVQVWKK